MGSQFRKTEIRPLHVSYEDVLGGSARAAHRIHTGLQREGIDSKMLSAHKLGNDPTITIPRFYRFGARREIATQLERLPHRICVAFGAKHAVWSTNYLPTLGPRDFDEQGSNIVHFHWIGGGIVPLATVPKIKSPIVWTLHDMWGFTGGCHYTGQCTRYRENCGACPSLVSSHQNDLSRIIWNAKEKHWRSVDFVIVSPSRWLADCAAKSSLFGDKRIEVIPCGLDTELYRPRPKEVVRSQLGLRQDAKLILFGAMSSTSDRRKGYHLLQPALQLLAEQMKQDDGLAKLELVVVGADKPKNDSPSIPTHYMGYVNDESKMAALYAAADLFVAPSIEDNLPNTVLEALACGIPTVAFNIGGMPDMIEHQANGYLATPFEVDDLAKGMAWVLADNERRSALARRARAKALEEFSMSLCARRYMSLYSELLEAKQITSSV